MGNLPLAMNNRSQVVGVSDLTGDTTFHAFLWTNDKGMQDLGTLPGDSFSIAFSINNKGQVVGQSCDINFNCRAALWENDVMIDLNTVIAPKSSLFSVQDINDQGNIVGQAFDPTTGRAPAFLPTRCEERTNEEGCEDGAETTTAARGQIGESPKFVLPENVRRMVRERIARRYSYHGFGVWPDRE